MRAITKLPEPHSLTQHRAAAQADYANYTDKDTLRVQLVQEQRGLCCFCGGRIEAAGDRMKIAHWMPQDPYPQHQSYDDVYWGRFSQHQPPRPFHRSTNYYRQKLSVKIKKKFINFS